MTLRAGRRAFYLGFAALCGICAGALPAAAQNYLQDNGGNVTVDYSVLGQGGPGPVTRGALPGGAMPAGGCSCANAPMGVIAAAPRPTFTNPFGAQITQAPAVPPGFLAYSQISGTTASSSGDTVVLREPSAPVQQMAATETPAIEEQAPLPATTKTQSSSGESTPSESTPSESALPATTPTQSAPSTSSADQAAAAPAGEATPPGQPEAMPTEVPSPVEQPPAAEATPPAEAPAETPPAEQAPAPAETQTAEAPATPPAEATEQPAPEATQQAAVTPEAPAGGTPPAESGGALPAGATRILYTGESDDVPADATAQLDALVQEMAADQGKRIQVLCYAAGTEDTESKARRKSLARGLAIRSYLYKAGVSPTRIDVRALGNKSEGGPADRVDIVPAS